MAKNYSDLVDLYFNVYEEQVNGGNENAWNEMFASNSSFIKQFGFKDKALIRAEVFRHSGYTNNELYSIFDIISEDIDNYGLTA